jgi:hypothetical protein
MQWTNIGGQLLPVDSLHGLLHKIKDNFIQSWEEVHQLYEENGNLYSEQKLQHAYASLLELQGTEKLDRAEFKKLLLQTLEIKKWMVKNIHDSRAKDYQNEFRKMVYDNEKEMAVVVGKLEDNVFINQQKEELERFKASVENIIGVFKL